MSRFWNIPIWTILVAKGILAMLLGYWVLLTEIPSVSLVGIYFGFVFLYIGLLQVADAFLNLKNYMFIPLIIGAIVDILAFVIVITTPIWDIKALPYTIGLVLIYNSLTLSLRVGPDKHIQAPVRFLFLIGALSILTVGVWFFFFDYLRFQTIIRLFEIALFIWGSMLVYLGYLQYKSSKKKKGILSNAL